MAELAVALHVPPSVIWQEHPDDLATVEQVLRDLVERR